jgi:hypothetical protein
MRATGRWHALGGQCYGSRMTAPWRRAALLVLLCAGCTRSGGTVELLAPFSDDSVVGQLTASWHETGNVRAESASEPGAREVAFRVDALNRLSDPLYLRLRDFRLTAGDGTSARSAATIECALAPGSTPAVLSGTLWMPSTERATIRGFRLDHFALPLSERGRAFYREFLLQQGREAAAIDAELAVSTAAPVCHSAQ